jgi:predicted MFS family arabinose efflux permease
MSRRRDWRGVAVVALCYSLASTTGICSPEILAALMKPAPHGFGLSISSAGLLLTVEMIANGCFSLAARLFERCSSRTLIFTGFLATLLADIATAGASNLGLLMLLRTVAGAGLGVVTIAVSRFIASSDNPDQLSSTLLVSSTVLGGAVLVGFGNLGPSATVVFAILAGLAALGLTTSFAGRTLVRTSGIEVPGAADAATAAALLPRLFIIGAMGLLNTADNGLYALTGVVAEHAGVSEVLFGYILTGAMVAGILAAIAAGWLRNATSRSLGLTAAILTKACVAVALVRMTSAGGFGAMATLNSFTQFFAVPLLLGASAHLDRRGRLAAQVSGAIQLGGALGPAWAGSLAELSGTRAVATVCAVALVASAALCLAPLQLIRRTPEDDRRSVDAA